MFRMTHPHVERRARGVPRPLRQELAEQNEGRPGSGDLREENVSPVAEPVTELRIMRDTTPT
jgi:hypothetical protein